MPNYLTKVFNIPIPVFFFRGKIVFLKKEIGEWGGTSMKGRTRYTSVVKENVEYVSNDGSNERYYASPVKPANGGCSTYSTDVVWGERKMLHKNCQEKFIYPFSGFVYCCTVDGW